MNKFYRIFGLMLLSAILPLSLQAQNEIPNNSFENWTGGAPDGWTTSNIPQATPVTQSGTAHSGSSAARGEVVSFMGFPYGPSHSSDAGGLPFAVTQNYQRLTGFYQFSPAGVGTDNMIIAVYLYDASFGGVAGKIDTLSPAASYTQFSIEPDYSTGNGGDAAYARIQIAVGGQGTFSLGTFFLVDDLEFQGVVGIEPVENQSQPQQFALQQNYPNPFNPSTTFKFSIPKSAQVQLAIYNQLGQEVARVVDERLASGTYTADWNAENLPSGIYLYRLTAGDYVESNKMLLVK